MALKAESLRLNSKLCTCLRASHGYPVPFSGLRFNTAMLYSPAPCPIPGFGSRSPKLWPLSSTFSGVQPLPNAPQSSSRKAATFSFYFTFFFFFLTAVPGLLCPLQTPQSLPPRPLTPFTRRGQQWHCISVPLLAKTNGLFAFWGAI